MANNFPLKVNPSSRRIEEFNTGDTVDLTGNNIVADSIAGANGQYLKSNGTKVIWDTPGNVYLTGVQTVTNKTFTSCTINGTANTITNIQNSSLANSTITINGVPIPLGGSVASADSNTTYTISAVDSITNKKIIRLTSGGTGAGVNDDIVIAGGANISLARSGDEITITATDTNTTYTSGNGLALSGTVFSLKDNANFTANYLLKWNDVNKQLSNSIINESGSTISIAGSLTTTGTTSTGSLKVDASILPIRNGNLLTGNDAQFKVNRTTDGSGNTILFSSLEWYEAGPYWRINDGSAFSASITKRIVTDSEFQTLTNKTFITPVLGEASATTVNKLTITPPTTSSTLTIKEAKILEVSTGVFFDVQGSTTSLANNFDIAFQLTSNTNLSIRVRGSDGTTRTANITLA
jgi:hypothetical protein